ncbi:MAG: iron ABC transporter permease [Candidatus Methanomethylophilaceae archaeon]|nr:iron ABC transporter permease [Candidatus Methanomethylophilaceae archaeon]
MTFYSELEKDPMLSKAVVDTIDEWDTGIQGDDVSFTETVKEYKRLQRMKYVFIAVCAAVIGIVAGYSITIGSYDIGFVQAYEIIWDHIRGIIPEDMTTEHYVVWNLRLPRVVIGVFGGAGLAVAGVVMQSILKNPLADSYTTGVSSGAGFGATLAMTAGLAVGSSYGVIILAFLFSLIPTGIIIAISKMSNASPTTMIMAGIGTMYIFNAMTTVMMLWADPQALAQIYAWQVGSLGNGGVSIENAPIVIVAVLACVIVIQLMAGKINVLATGDESAKALGIDADKMRIILLMITGMLAAAVVSFVGLVGFVGLVTPHICRMFIGADNRYLIPASALFGGMLMIVADQIGRVALSTPLPVGVVMSFIGGPVFIWLILRKSKNVW